MNNLFNGLDYVRTYIFIAQTNKEYSIQNFHVDNKKYSLISRNRKIVIQKQ